MYTETSQIAFSSTEFAEGELPLFLDTAEQFGVRNLELWFPKHVNPPNATDVKDELDRRGMRCVCVSTWSQLNTDSETIKRVLTGIELAEVLGAGLTNTYFGANPSRSREEAVDAYAVAIAPAVERARGAGVAITLENEFDVEGKDAACSDVTRRADGSRAIWEAVDSPHFTLTFDPGNYYVAGEEAFPRAYKILWEAFAYVHIKDVTRLAHGVGSTVGCGPRYEQISGVRQRVVTDPTGEYVFVPVGDGAINWAGLLEALKANEYRGFLTLEPHTTRELLNECYRRSLGFLAEFGFGV